MIFLYVATSFLSNFKSIVWKTAKFIQSITVGQHTRDNLSMTMLEIWFSFPGDCDLLPGDCSRASLTYHFEVFFG